MPFRAVQVPFLKQKLYNYILFGRFPAGRALHYNLFGEEKSPKRISISIPNAKTIIQFTSIISDILNLIKNVSQLSFLSQPALRHHFT